MCLFPEIKVVFGRGYFTKDREKEREIIQNDLSSYTTSHNFRMSKYISNEEVVSLVHKQRIFQRVQKKIQNVVIVMQARINK